MRSWSHGESFDAIIEIMMQLVVFCWDHVNSYCLCDGVGLHCI